ncbi:Listeria/Bacterioides repeat-containing protein [Fibrobacter sp. UWH9]|uniref:InlB B-repeat-containing protein n=1 Tax=Fibrobacter sp. UWH9 TaxID=1896213 RepID=UPI00091B3975|nr:InlB B-repeat-containing protein [Fibrobacter sp. UWH9]SHH73996.1 Listeria/Bacterioides repeat-containing protein [Fibrobacter sp. UWH9]
MKPLKLNVLFVFLGLLFAAGQSWGALRDTTISDVKYKVIASADDLVEFSTAATNTDIATVHEKPVSKINGIVVAPINMEGKSFSPIGTKADDDFVKFAGIFDGQGYSISNLKITSEYQDVGLFAQLGGGTIKDVILENVYISSGKTGTLERPGSTGGIVGWMDGGLISGCYVSGTIMTTGSKSNAGGIVGYSDEGVIRNCLSTASIIANGTDTYIGGIVGCAQNKSEKDNFYSDGKTKVEYCAYDGNTLIGSGYVGGIAGVDNQASKEAGKLEGCQYNSNAIQQGVGNHIAGEGDHKDSDQPTVDEEKGTTGVSDLNSEEVVCNLNGGTYQDGECKNKPDENEIWSHGSNITNTGVSEDNKGEIIFTIYFDANGGKFDDGANTEKQLKAETKITADGIPEPKCEGKTFVGWSLDADATESSSLGEVSKTTTVYAVWVADVLVTFDANGSKFADESEQKVLTFKYGKVITAADVENPADLYPADYVAGEGENKVYHAFVGWALASDATEPAEDLGTAKDAITIYAVWKKTSAKFFTVKYDVVGKGVAPSSGRVEEGYRATQPTDVTADGYEFAGWYTSATYEGMPFDFESHVTEDITLYAKWIPVQYTIEYKNLEGGENDVENPSYYNVESATIDLKEPSMEGKNFEGWYYDEAKTNVALSIPTGSFGNKVFYAKWSDKTYTITYLAGEGATGKIDPQVKTHGQPITLSSGGFESSYDLAGWSLSNGGEKAYELGQTINENKDLMLYPYWKTTKYAVNYEISYEDALGVMRTETYRDSALKGITVVLRKLDIPGYSFDKWDGASYTRKIAFVESTKDLSIEHGARFTMVEYDVTVKGTYKINSYSLVYKLNGATYDSTVVKYGTTLTLKDDPAVDPGYKFDGWSDLPATMPDHDVVVAGFTELQKFEVTFKNGESEIGKNSVAYGTAPVFDGILPVKDHYKFAGWNDGLVTYTADQLKGYAVVSDVAFTVVWDTVITVIVKNTSGEDVIVEVGVPTGSSDEVINNKINNAIEDAKKDDPMIVVPSVGDKDKDGHEFNGKWKPNGDGNYEPVYEVPDDCKEIVVVVGDETINVTIKNGDTDADVNNKINDAVKDAGIVVPAKDGDGYKFNGEWEQNKDGAYEPVHEKTVQAEVAGKNIPVDIKKGDSADDISDKINDALAEAAKTDPAVVVPAKDEAGRDFNGKWEDADGDDKYTPVYVVPDDSKVIEVVVGKDTIEVVVPKDASDEEVEQKINEVVTKPVVGDKDEDGYQFNGEWEQDKDGNYEPVYEKTVQAEVAGKDIPVDIKKGDSADDISDKINDAVAEAAKTDPAVVVPAKDEAGRDFNGKWEDADGDDKYTPVYVVPDDSKVIEVVVGKDTIEVVVPKDASDEEIKQKIEETLNNHDPKIEVPESEDGFEFNGEWKKDDDGNYVPVYEKEIVVVIGNTTISVVIDKDDSDDDVNQKINDAVAEISKKDSSIVVPVVGDKDSVGNEFDGKWEKDEYGNYVPVYSKAYKIVYVMPSNAVLSSDVSKYVLGKGVQLPSASIKDDESWKFMGWYETEDYAGLRVKFVGAEAKGRKTFYALFQKTVHYKAGDVSGKMEVVFNYDVENSDEVVQRALMGVAPEGYTKKGVDYVFDKWVLSDGVYVAKFVDASTGMKNIAVARHFGVSVSGRTLNIVGAKQGDKMLVVDMKGKIVAQDRISGVNHIVELTSAGNYLVRVNGVSTRVMVR